MMQKNMTSKLKARERNLEEGFGRQLWLQKIGPGPRWKHLGKVRGGKLAPKRVSQAMDEGGGRDDTKQVEDVRPRMVRGRRDLVPENGYVGSENREDAQLQGVF